MCVYLDKLISILPFCNLLILFRCPRCGVCLERASDASWTPILPYLFAICSSSSYGIHVVPVVHVFHVVHVLHLLQDPVCSPCFRFFGTTFVPPKKRVCMACALSSVTYLYVYYSLFYIEHSVSSNVVSTSCLECRVRSVWPTNSLINSSFSLGEDQFLFLFGRRQSVLEAWVFLSSFSSRCHINCSFL